MEASARTTALDCFSVSLEYASDHLLVAVRSLTSSERPLQEFKDFWHRYTAPSDDRQSTKLRGLTHQELLSAVSELVALSTRTAVVTAHAPADQELATLAASQSEPGPCGRWRTRSLRRVRILGHRSVVAHQGHIAGSVAPQQPSRWRSGSRKCLRIEAAKVNRS